MGDTERVAARGAEWYPESETFDLRGNLAASLDVVAYDSSV